MFVSILKTRSRHANGHTRKCCRNKRSNAPAVTREEKKDGAGEEDRPRNQETRRPRRSDVRPCHGGAKIGSRQGASAHNSFAYGLYASIRRWRGRMDRFHCAPV